jgi:serine/threonine protein kinase
VSTEAFWRGVNITITRGRELSKEECRKLKKASIHMNLLRFYGNVTNIKNKEYFFFAWESVQLISLDSVLSRYSHKKNYSENFLRKISEKILVKILLSISAALVHLHSKSMHHGNLNPSTILLYHDGSVKLKGKNSIFSVF